MSFLCPDCLTAGTLKIISRLELPPDSRSDEITLQIVRCYHCRFQGIAVYEESRRGSFDSESVNHYGYYVGEADLQNLRRLIEQCPNPGDSRCTCSVHQRLGSKDGNGRWSGIADIDLGQSFLMRID
jgi:hypothetical protein